MLQELRCPQLSEASSDRRSHDSALFYILRTFAAYHEGVFTEQRWTVDRRQRLEN